MDASRPPLRLRRTSSGPLSASAVSRSADRRGGLIGGLCRPDGHGAASTRSDLPALAARPGMVVLLVLTYALLVVVTAGMAALAVRTVRHLVLGTFLPRPGVPVPTPL